jgi:hypothetical protein
MDREHANPPERGQNERARAPGNWPMKAIPAKKSARKANWISVRGGSPGYGDPVQ